MYALSKFSFFQNYNKEKFTKQEAESKGLSGTEIKKCDKNGDGNVSIDEILENTEACAKILANINTEHAKVVNEIKEVIKKKIEVEDKEKTENKTPEKSKFVQKFKNIFRADDRFEKDFKDYFKVPNRFGDDFKFNVAA